MNAYMVIITVGMGFAQFAIIIVTNVPVDQPTNAFLVQIYLIQMNIYHQHLTYRFNKIVIFPPGNFII